MAITNTTLASPTYNGNGATTAFATGFQFINNSDLLVIVTSSTGVETVQTITTHYTVTGAGLSGGGTVTFVAAPAAGTKVNIRSNVTIDQQTDYLEGGSFSAATHEDALDKLTKISQQIKEITDRSLKLPSANQSIATTLTAPTATYVLRLSADGTALEWASPATVALGTTVSAYAQTLLDDADASASRTTLGLGTIATQAANNVAITGGSITGITDMALADGGTGASLADPGADRIMFWDDSAGAVTWLTAGTNLTITGTTLDASGGAGTNTFNTIAVSGQSDVVADSATDTLTLVAGSGMTITTNAGTDEITFMSSGGASAASQAEQETASSTTVYVSPGRQQFHPSSAKFWVRFNGTGVLSTISSYNVTSVTDNGTGDYTVTINTDFGDALWAASVFSTVDVTTTNYAPRNQLINSVAGGSIRVETTDGGSSNEDHAYVTVIGYGDQ